MNEARFAMLVRWVICFTSYKHLLSLYLLTNNLFPLSSLRCDDKTAVTSNNVYEIHRYQHDNFQYVVARTINTLKNR
jgi:hypothetical protein